MGSEKKRVQFRAPNRLIDRTDTLADVLGPRLSQADTGNGQ